MLLTIASIICVDGGSVNTSNIRKNDFAQTTSCTIQLSNGDLVKTATSGALLVGDSVNFDGKTLCRPVCPLDSKPKYPAPPVASPIPRESTKNTEPVRGLW